MVHGIAAGVLIQAADRRWLLSALAIAFAAAGGEFEHFVVIELFFEVLAVGEKVEELEPRFLGLIDQRL
ncbi:hypothetical protein D9M68_967230 [compost metagenome]